MYKVKRAWKSPAAFAAAVVLLFTGWIGAGRGEKELVSVWVLCQPDSFVYIRMGAKKTSDTVGRAECGMEYWTDGKKKNGFLHVYGNFEAGEGWINLGYIVYEEPARVFEKRTIDSNGRVAVRATIKGKRNRWMKSGEAVTVYYMAEYAVTDRGFIDSEFIGGPYGETGD